MAIWLLYILYKNAEIELKFHYSKFWKSKKGSLFKAVVAVLYAIKMGSD